MWDSGMRVDRLLGLFGEGATHCVLAGDGEQLDHTLLDREVVH